MKQLRSNLFVVLLLTITMAALSSCDEDYWWRTRDIVGDWRVVEVSDNYGRCPYYYNDRLTFTTNGDFYADGTEGFSETGRWTLRCDYILIDFGTSQLRGYIRQLDASYLILDIDDDSFGSYTLRLVKVL